MNPIRKTLPTRRGILLPRPGCGFLLPFPRRRWPRTRSPRSCAVGIAEWSDGFDAAGGGAADVRTTTPILSAEIVDAARPAITQYSDIVARGGWPLVPTEKR